MHVRLTMVGVLVAASLVSAQVNPYVGRWNITGTGPDTDKVYFLEVKQNGAGLEGLFLDRVAHATPVSWIRVEGGELAWQYGGGGETLPKPACGPVYRARLENGKLIGHHTTPGEPCPSPQRAGRGGAGGNAPTTGAAPPAPAPREINWVGVRQPVWPPSNANGTHTFGTPVMLVGPGVGKDVWTGTTPTCVDRWAIVDGLWKNEAPKPGERPTCNPYRKRSSRTSRLTLNSIWTKARTAGCTSAADTSCSSRSGKTPVRPLPGVRP